jgi:hypothetical protein
MSIALSLLLDRPHWRKEAALSVTFRVLSTSYNAALLVTLAVASSDWSGDESRLQCSTVGEKEGSRQSRQAAVVSPDRV